MLLIAPSFDLFMVSLVVVVFVILGIVVFFNNRQSLTNRTFLVFSLVAAGWSIFSYLSYQLWLADITIWLVRSVMFMAVWHSFFFFQLCFVFLEDHVEFSWAHKFILIPLAVLLSLTILTPLVFNQIVDYSQVEGLYTGIKAGPGIIFFTAFAVPLVLGGIYLLVKKERLAKGEKKMQFRIFLSGSVIYFCLIFVFAFFLPAFLNNITFNPYVIIFNVPFLLAIGYSIGRWQLFNIKIAGAKILAGVIAVIVIWELFFSFSSKHIGYRIFFALLVLALSVLLYKSIKKEIKHREEIAHMADSLEKAKSYLQAVNAQKIAAMAMLADQLHGEADGPSLQALTTQLRGASRQQLSNMISAILIMSSLGQKESVKMVPADINKIISKAIIEAAKRSVGVKLSDISYEPIVSSLLQMDEEKITMAIIFLLDNALKYDQSRPIYISTRRNQEGLAVWVNDRGIGFAKADHDNFFNNPYRGKQTMLLNLDGAGLSLCIVRQIAEAHGGRVWAQSYGVGKGAEFGFALPNN